MTERQGVENQDGKGSMYGVVDNLGRMTKALEETLAFLPENFVWPTNVAVSPFSVYLEWGRDNSEERGVNSVWVIANAEGVVMNADFRPDWPDCGAAEFDAKTLAGWLKELTQKWEWGASQNGSTTSSHLKKSAEKIG